MEEATKTTDLEFIKDLLVNEFKTALSKGVQNVSTYDLAEMADAIKDTSEAIAKCYEAHYYKAVTDAMHGDYDDGRKYYPRMYDATMKTAPYRDNAWRMADGMDFADWHADPETERYGRTYSDYRKARRNYTETKSDHDQMVMRDTASRHVDNAMSSLREMWSEADPELKTRMKNDLTKLVNEMTV